MSLLSVLLTQSWLFTVAWQDVRRNEVSGWLTIPPLIVSAVWWWWQGEWAVVALLAIVIFVGELFERLHLPAVVGMGPAVATAGFLACGSSRPVALVLTAWTCAWAAWTLHFVGGADAKVFMALVAFFPEPLLVSLLIAVQVIWSVYHLLRRYKGMAFRVVWTEMMSRPTAEDLEARGVPLLPAYATAGAIFFSVHSLLEYVVGLQAAWMPGV
jgi:Flp pilus assembly protein protease CpaA